MEKSLTILIPVYNEEDCIKSLCVEIDLFLNHYSHFSQVLFIDDGSTDNGVELIEKMCEKDSRYSFISLKKNGGLSTALKAGIDHCETELIGYIDADLQTSPADFEKLIEFVNEYDLVTGYRVNRRDTIVKKLSSRVANSFRQWLLHDDIVDNCCPLKIMRTEIAKQMPFFKGMHRFIPDMVMLLGGKVKQVPIQHYPRIAGKAKYHLSNRMLGPLIDALAFRWMQRNAIQYSVRRESRCKTAKHEQTAR